MQLIPRRLYIRLVLAVAVVMIAGTFGLSFWTADNQSRQLLAARRQQTTLLTQNLAEGAAHYYVLEDYAALDHYLSQVASLPGLRRIIATDTDGNVLSAFAKADDTQNPQMLHALERCPLPASPLGRLSREASTLVAWQPVKAGDLLGWVQVHYGLEEVMALQYEIWRRGVIFGTIEVLCGIFLVMLLLRKPIRSISSLSSFARELPQRKGSTVAVERYVSEVQDLGESLNYASTELYRIEHELLELNRTLEERVEVELVKSREKDALLLQQARYQTLGELLVNIAHHWRQPLNNIGVVVQENAWLIANGELPPACAMQAAEQAVLQLKQLSRSIEGFQLLCKPAEPSEQLLPSDAVQRAILMVQEGYRQAGISFELQVRSEQTVNGSLQDLVQCLLNLFSNARDAIVAHHEPGGRIMVAIDLPHENALQITVSDNGGGIPPTLVHSVFDPYVTSKFRAQGVGLGLFVVRQIIEQRFQGSVSAGNRGDGAVITLELPLEIGRTA